jgi:uroporphyrinogen decarboxylase
MKNRKLLQTINGEKLASPPIWLMRQAGRYLPEYKATRKEAGSFLDLCYSPALAEEVTLQPIRRFGFDASILFSDILVLPHALGQHVWFEEGHGPRLEPLKSVGDFAQLDQAKILPFLQPVFETVSRLRASLPDETALIGFAGAPFTLATYMLTGEGSKDQAHTRSFAYANPDAMQELIDILTQSCITYLSAQIEAGADVVKLFDSWAGALADEEILRWSFEPLQKITAALKAKYPNTPVMLFPRGVGMHYERFAKQSGADVLAFDYNVPAEFIADKVYPHIVVQGGLDPLSLVAGGDGFEASVKRYLKLFDAGRYIFNLGHGIVPQTPIAHVERLIELVRS